MTGANNPDLIPALTERISQPGYWREEALAKLRAAVEAETCALCHEAVPIADASYITQDPDEEPVAFCATCFSSDPRQCAMCDCWGPEDDGAHTDWDGFLCAECAYEYDGSNSDPLRPASWA